MKLYELDQYDRDEKVATLSYGNVHVEISCNGAWDCSGESDWASPTYVNPQLSKVSAKIQIRVKSERK